MPRLLHPDELQFLAAAYRHVGYMITTLGNFDDFTEKTLRQLARDCHVDYDAVAAQLSDFEQRTYGRTD